MSARLARAGIRPTEDNRCAYRELLITTSGLAEGISGVVMCDETFRQSTSDGRTFPIVLRDLGMLAGVKVDNGPRPLAVTNGEMITEGLDGLRERLAEYAALGATFAKWRAVIMIGEGKPSSRARRANAHALGRYAALCQEAGIVPIVEPEVLMGGSHSMAACAAATTVTLIDVFSELREAGVRRDTMVLMPNMVAPGRTSGEITDPEQIAKATIGTLHNVVPDDVAGIAFLSGGQPAVRATENLGAMARFGAPWPITFAFGRALTDPALAAWQGRDDRIAAGQSALAHRVHANAAALTGLSIEALERDRVTSFAGGRT